MSILNTIKPALITGIATLLLASCSDRADTALERVRQDGYLVVVTRQSPTTYYQGPYGEMGLEHELSSRFARSLGVRLKYIIPESHEDIFKLVKDGKAHLAAAGLSITEAAKKHVRFGPVYQKITQQLIYRLGSKRPRSIKDLYNKKIRIKAGSAHSVRLHQLKKKYPLLAWEESTENETEELMDMVWRKKLDYTIADSNEVATIQRYYPELRVAFDLTDKDEQGKPVSQKVAWAFRRDNDNSLYDEAVKFFLRLKKTGELEQLRERYYGHIDQFNYYQITTYKKRIKERLPQFRSIFQKEAKRNNLDWRLLAAIGYQESHWNPYAKSPTGVRGLMMLTLSTAKRVRIRDRRNPVQSIIGGARYFRMIKDKIDIQVTDPDRTWFALAAYNVGIGHLQDAQQITRKLGKDPYKWIDVRKALPLLTKAKWHKNTRYGYARGYEPVAYVRNIRRFYDLLVREDDKQYNLFNTLKSTKKNTGKTRTIPATPIPKLPVAKARKSNKAAANRLAARKPRKHKPRKTHDRLTPGKTKQRSKKPAVPPKPKSTPANTQAKN